MHISVHYCTAAIGIWAEYDKQLVVPVLQLCSMKPIHNIYNSRPVSQISNEKKNNVKRCWICDSNVYCVFNLLI